MILEGNILIKAHLQIWLSCRTAGSETTVQRTVDHSEMNLKVSTSFVMQFNVLTIKPHVSSVRTFRQTEDWTA